jgi:hypothetical protein
MGAAGMADDNRKASHSFEFDARGIEVSSEL